MHILITDHNSALARAKAFGPTHLVDFSSQGLGSAKVLPAARLRVEVNKKTEATDDRLAPLVEFLETIPADTRLLICCEFGVSRSATAALFAMCLHDRSVRPRVHFDRLKQAWPHVVLQRGMVRVGDRLMHFGGELEACVFEDADKRVSSLPVLTVQGFAPLKVGALAPARSYLRRRLRTFLMWCLRRL